MNKQFFTIALILLCTLCTNINAECHGQVGGGCSSHELQSTCCGTSIVGALCCHWDVPYCHCDSGGCYCSPFSFRNNETKTGKTTRTVQTTQTTKIIHKVTVSDQHSYKVNAKGIIYSEYATTAEFDGGFFRPGRLVHSSKLKKGDLIWWPETDKIPESNRLIVLPIEHHNVSATNKNCCWSITIGIPKCEFKYCCGHGCCC